MIAQTVDDLANAFRSDVDDQLKAECGDEDCLWKNSDVYRYMTEAVDAVMQDTGTKSKRISVPYTVNIRNTRIPAGIIGIESVVTDKGTSLKNTNTNDWRSGTATPSQLILDNTISEPTSFSWENDARTLELYPTPSTSGTLEMFVTMTLPMAIVSGMLNPLPSIRDERLVLMYMKYLAYAKHDAETLDLSRSDMYFKMYTAQAMERESEIRRQQRAPGFVRMNW